MYVECVLVNIIFAEGGKPIGDLPVSLQPSPSISQPPQILRDIYLDRIFLFCTTN